LPASAFRIVGGAADAHGGIVGRCAVVGPAEGRASARPDMQKHVPPFRAREDPLRKS